MSIRGKLLKLYSLPGRRGSRRSHGRSGTEQRRPLARSSPAPHGRVSQCSTESAKCVIVRDVFLEASQGGERGLTAVEGGGRRAVEAGLDLERNATLGAPATVAARVWHAAARLVLRKARVAPVRSRLDGGRQAEHRDEEHCQLHCVDTAVSAHGRAGRWRVCRSVCGPFVWSVCGANTQGAVRSWQCRACSVLRRGRAENGCTPHAARY
eukprot:scaffold55575_cov71-Phaeocystis_antarctica.AAC.1